MLPVCSIDKPLSLGLCSKTENLFAWIPQVCWETLHGSTLTTPKCFQKNVFKIATARMWSVRLQMCTVPRVKLYTNAKIKQNIDHLIYMMYHLIYITLLRAGLWTWRCEIITSHPSLRPPNWNNKNKWEVRETVSSTHSLDKENKCYWTSLPPLTCQMLSKDLPVLFFVSFLLKEGMPRKIPITVKTKICFPNTYFENQSNFLQFKWKYPTFLLQIIFFFSVYSIYAIKTVLS